MLDYFFLDKRKIAQDLKSANWSNVYVALCPQAGPNLVVDTIRTLEEHVVGVAVDIALC
jgi:hypothetical protein